MSEMVERVCAALSKVRDVHRTRMYAEGGMDQIKRCPEPSDLIYARAAIAAMREPTEAMIDAYYERCDIGGDLIDDRTDEEDARGEHYGAIKRAFGAMIDAALAENEE